ncbi:ABC transporter substrate-binding protein, partial [Sandarakinorhabdus sp.]|uniref:MlaC/ttg2D family ABC transporter substrate-binding protein n=1 Tax=Sandarakinorhabdus sp. TaxID=1916663 RepID=UPI00286DC612
AASPGDPAARGLIETMVGEGFATLRDKSLTKAASRARFRALLQSNVALADIGDRLIRRIRIEEKITPAQYSAYQAALPEFILGAYADRLYDYDQAVVKVVRTIGRGPFTEVHTRVTRPGAQPVDAIWQVKRTPAGKLMVNNLVVSNINLTLTQEADFAAYAKKNGFDALVNFLKTSNGKRSPT